MLNTSFEPWPSFTQEEADAVSRAILSNKVNYWTGTECREFEKEFAAYTQRELENKVDIYFGGKNNPAGYGHGHYIVRLSDGRVLYRSSPTTSINQ